MSLKKINVSDLGEQIEETIYITLICFKIYLHRWAEKFSNNNESPPCYYGRILTSYYLFITLEWRHIITLLRSVLCLANDGSLYGVITLSWRNIGRVGSAFIGLKLAEHIFSGTNIIIGLYYHGIALVATSDVSTDLYVDDITND